MNVSRFLIGLLLTAAAGAVDAVSFVRLGAVYASFMSGNTIQIGIHAAGLDYVVLASFVILVGLFMLGSFVGAFVMAKAGRWHLPVILALEVIAVGIALSLDLFHGVPLMTTAPLSFAMGAQNHLIVMVKGANPGTTFVTGTAFRFADALAQRVMGRDAHGAWRLHLAVWFSFALGAGAGTISQLRLREYALVPIFSLLAGLLIVAIVSLLRGQDSPRS